LVDPKQDMALLYEVEYGVRNELIVRLVTVGIGSVLMYLYLEDLRPFLWTAGYFLAHAVHFLYIRSHLASAEMRHLRTAGGLYLCVVAAFLWWPALMAASHEAATIYVGSVLIGSTIIYQIRRGDRLLWMIWGQVALFALSLLWVMQANIHHFEGALGHVGAVVVTAAVCAYTALAMLYSRRSRLALEEAAHELAQDQKMSAIGRLAGGVAHDFNNMLTVVLGNLELFHLIETEDERNAAVTEAEMAAKRAEGVVQHLLVYARKAPMRMTEVDLSASVAEVSGLVRAMVPERVVLRIVTDPRPMPVRLDENQLTTALLNLVKNAVDAMPQGGELRISTTPTVLEQPRGMANGDTLRPGYYACLAVGDSGSGIPPEIIERVLEPFFTTKPPGKGTGLGLSMVVGFVLEQGGGLEITSNQNGTRMTLFFPMLQGESARL
jgi:signal transduction histidine kinase